MNADGTPWASKTWCRNKEKQNITNNQEQKKKKFSKLQIAVLDVFRGKNFGRLALQNL